MNDIQKFFVDLISKDLLDMPSTHTLIYGKPENTFEVLQGVYDVLVKREEFRCTLYNPSEINNPLDFFLPVIKMKYGEDYEQKAKPTVERILSLASANDLAGLCGREEHSSFPNARKTPVIFVDGIEQLLFKLDFPGLDKPFIRRYADMIRKRADEEHYTPIELPMDKGFGASIRARLHQNKAGVICGTVIDNASIDYAATLGNYNYMYYDQNFRLVYVDR